MRDNCCERCHHFAWERQGCESCQSLKEEWNAEERDRVQRDFEYADEIRHLREIGAR